MVSCIFQVLVLRELAVSAPTFFFQQVQPFFDNIFYAVWDPKQAIREGAVSALRACLILTTQRETKEMQKPQWYKVGHSTVYWQITILLFLKKYSFSVYVVFARGKPMSLQWETSVFVFCVTANL